MDKQPLVEIENKLNIVKERAIGRLSLLWESKTYQDGNGCIPLFIREDQIRQVLNIRPKIIDWECGLAAGFGYPAGVPELLAKFGLSRHDIDRIFIGL